MLSLESYKVHTCKKRREYNGADKLLQYFFPRNWSHTNITKTKELKLFKVFKYQNPKLYINVTRLNTNENLFMH